MFDHILEEVHRQEIRQDPCLPLIEPNGNHNELLVLPLKNVYSLICYILTAVSPSLPVPFLTPNPSPLLLISLQKRASPPGISTKHGILCWKKTRHLPSYWRLAETTRRRVVPKAGRRFRNITCSYCPESHKNTQLYNHNIHTKGLDQIYAGSLIISSVSESP